MITRTFAVIAGIMTMFTAFLIQFLSGDVSGSIMAGIIDNYGPIGVAVYVLYRRIDRLEDRVAENSKVIEENHE